MYWAVRLAAVRGASPLEILEMDTSEYRAAVMMLAKVDARIVKEREAGMPARR